MPVLMMDLPRVPDVRHALQDGDRLLFYTDGVTERPNPVDDMYDLPRLVAAFERTAERAPSDQVLALVEDLDTFAAEREPDDDQTLLLIAIEEQGKV
jgi:sigma-B regulation protein RsbU (phosphoserine phosphatase)